MLIHVRSCHAIAATAQPKGSDIHVNLQTAGAAGDRGRHLAESPTPRARLPPLWWRRGRARRLKRGAARLWLRRLPLLLVPLKIEPQLRLLLLRLLLLRLLLLKRL